jgi:hypothetical protein
MESRTQNIPRIAANGGRSSNQSLGIGKKGKNNSQAQTGLPTESSLREAGLLRDSNHQTERIAERAYNIWETNGRPDGRDIEFWLQAETEINQKQQQP